MLELEEAQQNMFINLSNHPFSNWPTEQKMEAEKLYGEVCDYPFPAVPVHFTSDDIVKNAERIVAEIVDRKDKIEDDSLNAENESDKARNRNFAVMCQGEFTLTYAIISLLQKAGIEVVSAVSERIVREEKVDEEIRKTAVFRFAGFREYPVL